MKQWNLWVWHCLLKYCRAILVHVCFIGYTPESLLPETWPTTSCRLCTARNGTEGIIVLSSQSTQVEVQCLNRAVYLYECIGCVGRVMLQLRCVWCEFKCYTLLWLLCRWGLWLMALTGLLWSHFGRKWEECVISNDMFLSQCPGPHGHMRHCYYQNVMFYDWLTLHRMKETVSWFILCSSQCCSLSLSPLMLMYRSVWCNEEAVGQIWQLVWMLFPLHYGLAWWVKREGIEVKCDHFVSLTHLGAPTGPMLEEDCR